MPSPQPVTGPIAFLRGAAKYYLRPEQRVSWGGPFNGQQRRQELFCEVARKLGVQSIVETGAFRGTTTEYMSSATGLEVWTTETNHESFGFCLARFVWAPRIHLRCSDSRRFLSHTVAKRLGGRRLLFYLDAHWYEDLPLAEELGIVFSFWPDAVVLVDDFQVPFDDGYGFDDYGPGRRLTLEYLSGLAVDELDCFFPAAPAQSETGARRGCCVLSVDARVSQRLRGCTNLREWLPD